MLIEKIETGARQPTFADALKKPPISERAQKIAQVIEKDTPFSVCMQII